MAGDGLSGFEDGILEAPVGSSPRESRRTRFSAIVFWRSTSLRRGQVSCVWAADLTYYSLSSSSMSAILSPWRLVRNRVRSRHGEVRIDDRVHVCLKSTSTIASRWEDLSSMLRV